MGTRVEQSSEFLPRASRTSRRHLEDMADSLHRLPSAAEDLQLIIPRCNRTLLLQGEFCITLKRCSKVGLAPVVTLGGRPWVLTGPSGGPHSGAIITRRREPGLRYPRRWPSCAGSLRSHS